MGRPVRGLKALGHDARLSCFDREFKTSRGVAHRSNRTKIVAKLRQVERLKDLELENSRPFT